MPFENKVCLQKQYPRVFTNQIDFDLFVVSFISRDHQVLQDLEGLMQFHSMAQPLAFVTMKLTMVISIQVCKTQLLPNITTACNSTWPYTRDRMEQKHFLQ